jgi:hypothetical protein
MCPTPRAGHQREKKKLQRSQREEAHGEVEREKGGRKVSPSNLFGHWRRPDGLGGQAGEREGKEQTPHASPGRHPRTKVRGRRSGRGGRVLSSRGGRGLHGRKQRPKIEDPRDGERLGGWSARRGGLRGRKAVSGGVAVPNPQLIRPVHPSLSSRHWS